MMHVGRSSIPWKESEINAAARQAAAIGGLADDEDLDPAEHPLAEAGEGVAEGTTSRCRTSIEAIDDNPAWRHPRDARGDPDNARQRGRHHRQTSRVSAA
jgi:hypothetical protein